MNPSQSDKLSGRIFTIRGLRVILDTDLARIYGTTTKVFNQSIKRNAARFSKDFAFQLTPGEFAILRSQFVTSNAEVAVRKPKADMWSQFVTTSRRPLGNVPWAFSEHGAVMATNVLRSPDAVAMSVYVVRAFIKQREQLSVNATILRRLAEIDKTLLEHDTALLTLWKKLQPLLARPPELPRRQIGFHVRPSKNRPGD